MIETERLIIRNFKENDFLDFKELLIDKMNSKWAQYDDQFPTDDENVMNILKYFAGGNEFFAVVTKDNNKVIGFVCLTTVNQTTLNLGYTLHTSYQGIGIGTEMAKRMMEYAHDELHALKLESGTAKINTPSVKLLTKLGFKVVKENKTAFACDKAGKPIEFVGCEFEYYFN